MRRTLSTRIAAIAVAMSFAATSALAFEAGFRDALEKGDVDGAAVIAQNALAATPDSSQAQFALGIARFLGAVEGLGQGLYDVGLKNEYSHNLLGLTGLPFLRLPVPDNPDPEPVSYDRLRGILSDFVDDMGLAEAALAQVSKSPVKLALDLRRVHLDLNGDGSAQPDENLALMFSAVAARMRVPEDLLFHFDESDAVWLRGYTHLLMAMAEVPLGYDWERAYTQTFHGLFPDALMDGDPMADETRRIEDAISAYYERPGGPPRYSRPPTRPSGMDYRDWLRSEPYQKWLESPEKAEYDAMRDLENALQWAAVADLVAFIHLFDWPVADAGRIASVREHLLQMILLSRENWRLILAETDDDREWLPSPKQTSRFTNMRVNERLLEGWNGFLDTFEAVLNGEALVRHWRFPGDRGINIRRMFEEPARLDPVLIGTGHGALPYLEDGSPLDAESLEPLANMIGRGFFAYFAWFN